MLTIACCLVVELGLGLDLMYGWLCTRVYATFLLSKIVSVLMQRFNAVLLHDSLPARTARTVDLYPNLYITILKLTLEYVYLRVKILTGL